jgi:hypothetical protein
MHPTVFLAIFVLQSRSGRLKVIFALIPPSLENFKWYFGLLAQVLLSACFTNEESYK